jgi:hypothetical protein
MKSTIKLAVRVIFDELQHLTLAYLVSLPFLIKGTLLTRLIPFVSVLVDLDHFASSRSLSIKKALTLPRRPPLHSLTVLILFTLLSLIFFTKRQTAVLFVSWLSHLIKDMGDGWVTIFWPCNLQVHLGLKRALFTVVLLVLTAILFSRVV